MENKTKIETTPTSIYQQPLENNRKYKQHLQLIINGNKTKIEKQYLPMAIENN